MLAGRLGLASGRIPQADRHGILWLRRGNLYVDSGTVRFTAAAGGRMAPGDYAIPFQMLNCILLEPGTTISHDALRILARHGVGLVAVGEGGVRFYASLPAGPDRSARARRQATLWASPEHRVSVARHMYALRLGEILPSTDINTLRGIEGSRVKETYRLLAQRFGIKWKGRRYDRNEPDAADPPNQAINHASTAVSAAAEVAVAVAGAIPQLGFVHEDSGIAFCLDIADMVRHSVTVPGAFEAVRRWQKTPAEDLERVVRRTIGDLLRSDRVIPTMIDYIKEVLRDDRSGSP